MEWIIGLIVVWIIWRVLSSKARRSYVIEDAIQRAYIANKNDMNHWIETPINWTTAVKYAQERGLILDNNAIYVDTSVNNEQITVTLMRNHNNGTTMIKMW